jgi:hypothetical protein
MNTQLSTTETSFLPFATGLKFESNGSTIDPPDNQGGGGTGTPAPEPEEEEDPPS